MNISYFKYLSDPVDDSRLLLKAFKKDSDEILDGILTGKYNWYPVIGGIPRMLIGDAKIELLQRKREFLKKYKSKLNKKISLEWNEAIKKIKDLSSFEKHQQKTADSFAYEWKNIYQENDYEKNNFYHFLSPFIKEKDLKGMATLDIGCGSGRFTKWATLASTKVSFATDLGDSVEVAYKMTKHLNNVGIVQADIYHMPFFGVIDFAYSIGVLHHLPQPKEGFLSLSKVLKRGGKMLIWVYNRRNNNRALYFYEPTRAVFRHIPKPILYKICYLPALLVHTWNILCKMLKLKKMPFSYYENFPFNMKLNDSFDVLATPKSNYYYSEEIEEWFNDAKLHKVRSYEHSEAGITCIGTHV